MRIAPPAPAVVANRGEKEAKLRQLIVGAVAVSGMNAITLVARAPDSPVARALTGAAKEISGAGIAMRVVLFEIESSGDEATPHSLLEDAGIDVRVLADPRFAAAHEQLTLGGSALWIGDCMRRDPSKRDAFEMHITGDAKAARHAECSFAKLWAAAKPLKRVVTGSVAPEVINARKTAKAQAKAKSGRDVSRR